MRLLSDGAFCLEDAELGGTSTRHGPIEANWAVCGGCGGRGKDEHDGGLSGVRALLGGLRGVDAGERWSRRRRQKEVVCYDPRRGCEVVGSPLPERIGVWRRDSVPRLV